VYTAALKTPNTHVLPAPLVSLPTLLTSLQHLHSLPPPSGYPLSIQPHTNISHPPPLSPPHPQIHRQFRKPLIIASPKSLLRHPKCKSPLSEFDDVPDDAGIVGVRFKRVIMDDAGLIPKNRGPNPPKVRAWPWAGLGWTCSMGCSV
jgi:hypothetical protein